MRRLLKTALFGLALMVLSSIMAQQSAAQDGPDGPLPAALDSLAEWSYQLPQQITATSGTDTAVVYLQEYWHATQGDTLWVQCATAEAFTLGQMQERARQQATADEAFDTTLQEMYECVSTFPSIRSDSL